MSAPTIPGYKITFSSSGSVRYAAQVGTIIFRYVKTDGNGTATDNKPSDNTNKPTTDPGQQIATGHTLPAGSRWKVFDAYKDGNGTI